MLTNICVCCGDELSPGATKTTSCRGDRCEKCKQVLSPTPEFLFQVKMMDYWQGHWTLEAPQRAGLYPVRPRGEGNAGMFFISVYHNPMTGEVVSTQSWGGWWWSVPHPDFPETPDERGDGECVPMDSE